MPTTGAALQEVLAGPQSEVYGPLPKIALPNNDVYDAQLLLRFALQLLSVLAAPGVPLYRRDNVVVYPYTQKQRLEVMEAKTFRTWVEHYCVCYKVTYDDSGHPLNPLKSMPKEAAEGVLACVDFWQGLPEVERCHPVPLPVLQADGGLVLLPAGYDAASKTLTFAP